MACLTEVSFRPEIRTNMKVRRGMHGWRFAKVVISKDPVVCLGIELILVARGDDLESATVLGCLVEGQLSNQFEEMTVPKA
jgi:hypothetical protein